jgi:hypothetical protein
MRRVFICFLEEIEDSKRGFEIISPLKMITDQICWCFFLAKGFNSHFLLVCNIHSVQEACTKCFAVHSLKFEILQIT